MTKPKTKSKNKKTKLQNGKAKTVSGANWTFEPTPQMGGAAGEAFTNTLASTGMSRAAVLAREAIQNSVDARQENDGKVLVRFRAQSLKGTEKENFVKAARLQEIKKHKSELHLQPPNCFEDLDGPDTEIKLLFVEDFYTTGLDGDPFEASSKFHRFLLSLGDGSKVHEEHRTGGSFGFGKSVYSSNSSIATIFAYSRYTDKEGESRSRIFGCAYFCSHKHDNRSYTGRAWFGARQLGDIDKPLVLPLYDDEADKLATKLGFDVRKSDERGLSVLIVDAEVESEQILKGTEDWWWPRLIGGALDVEVISKDGQCSLPRPRSRTELQPFIDAFEVTQRTNPGQTGRSLRKEFNKHHGRELGVCGFIVLEKTDDDKWPVPDNRLDSIALIRNPLMVVAYHRPYNTLGSPTVVGVFMASDDIDDMLRASESPAHDRWDVDSSRLRDRNGEQRETVNAVLNRIRSSFRHFQTSASPPPPPRPRRLSFLERSLATFLSRGKGGVKDGPDPTSAPINLKYEQAPYVEATDDDRLVLRTEFSIRLKPDVSIETTKVRLFVSCPVLEDGQEGESLAIKTYSDDVILESEEANLNAFVIELVHGEHIRIRCESEPYNRLWTVLFRPVIESMEDER